MDYYQEIEAKFYVGDLGRVERSLQGIGAALEQPRILELNLRFDTPDLALSKGYRVIRLRQDKVVRLTYKGPPFDQEGVKARQEIEFGVEDFQAARLFLEALGYQVSFIYEKYRSVYGWEGMHIALDELPFGNFVEIEGEEVQHIRRLSQMLGLDWEARVGDSYAILFDGLRQRLALPFRDLTFENFQGLNVLPEDMKLSFADA